MNHRNYALLLITAVLMALTTIATSCRSSNFKIKGELEGIGQSNIHIVYYASGSVHEEWVNTQGQGKFEFKGQSKEPTIAAILDTQSQLIACVMVENGDEISISGNAEKRYELKIKGNKEDENWCKFLNDNAKQLASGDSDAVNAAVEKYVKANPDDMTSTLLLLVNYDSSADPTRAKQLLKDISTDAKPQSLVWAFEALTANIGKPNDRLTALLLINAQSGKFGQLQFNGSSYTLLYIWGSETDDVHRADIARIRALQAATSAEKLQVADISLEPDSSFWRSTASRDSAQWLQFWAPEGPLNIDLLPLHITATPLALITDSTGRIVWHGHDCAAAIKAAQQQLAKLK